MNYQIIIPDNASRFFPKGLKGKLTRVINEIFFIKSGVRRRKNSWKFTWELSRGVTSTSVQIFADEKPVNQNWKLTDAMERPLNTENRRKSLRWKIVTCPDWGHSSLFRENACKIHYSPRFVSDTFSNTTLKFNTLHHILQSIGTLIMYMFYICIKNNNTSKQNLINILERSNAKIPFKK